MPAEIVVIVEDQNARPRTSAPIEPRRRQSADAGTDHDEVVALLDRKPVGGEAVIPARLRVRGLERAFVLAAQPGERGRIAPAGLAVSLHRRGEARGDGQRHPVEEVATRDRGHVREYISSSAGGSAACRRRTSTGMRAVSQLRRALLPACIGIAVAAAVLSCFQNTREKPVDQKIINLYDRFTHGGMTRREFLDRLTELAGSAAAAVALLPLLQNDYAQAAIVADNDPRLVTERLAFDSPKGRINGYLARARAGGKRPVVLVVHENRGLNPHLADVARRFAVEGYLGYAVDLLSLVGGTPASDDAARELHAKMNQDDAVVALVAAVSFLKSHPESTGKVGAVGFCFGGTMINRLAAASGELDAAVAYYGRQIPADQVPRIKAPLLLHYAGNDEGVNAGIAAYEAALKANNKRYTIHMYPGVQHSFNNDTGAARYDKAAAELA